MSSVTFGYHRAIQTQEKSRKVFSSSGKAFTIRSGQVIRIEIKPGYILEGPVYTVLDKYFTVGINQDTLSAICVFDNEFINIEIV
jgi:hypothetical protein